jgi:hypothetical protein
MRQPLRRENVVSEHESPKMEKITKLTAVAVLIFTMSCSALADSRRGHYPQGQHRSYQGRGHDSGWIAPLLFLGLAGAVIGASASQQSSPPPTYVQPYAPPQSIYVQPAPVYVAPAYPAPTVVAQPINAWYFCKSQGQYYPYTQYCPEGWQKVSPTPQ